MESINYRDENGRLLPGCPPQNPDGKNGHTEGWQPYGKRIQKWFAVPASELVKYIDNNGAKLKEQTAIDAACIRHVINTISGKHTLPYLKEALDRIEGQAKQSIDLTSRSKPQIDDTATPEELTEAMALLRSQT